MISNNEYGNIVKHGFKMYGKTASLFLYAWDTMAGLSQEVLYGGFGFAGTSVPHSNVLGSVAVDSQVWF